MEQVGSFCLPPCLAPATLSVQWDGVYLLAPVLWFGLEG